MAKTTGKLHVAMIPWSAFGHMIPFYQLSLALANRGVCVSYISTPRNIERLPEIPSDLVPLMQYVSLPLAQVPGLPKGAEATVDMEFDDIPYLKVAYDLLREPIKQFVSSHSPDWIISDFISHWLPEITQEYRVKLMLFSVITATTILFFGPPEFLMGEGQKRLRKTPHNMTTTPEWCKIFPPSVAYRPFEAAKIHSGIYDSNASGVTDGERLARMVQGCQAVGIRTCAEFERDYIKLYENLIQKPVIPAGLLLPAKVDEENTSGLWSEVLKWLDQQSSKSVVYVGFGSEYKLTKDEVYEIAYGLELAELPFIWALRRPTWAADDCEALQPGFMARTSSRKGFVCLGWAPQLKILAHPSVGGSLFHSGWGSIIETLQNGHNLILLPFIIDQGLNARLMVDKGLGIEVERQEDGSYTRYNIADALRRAMVGDEAEKIRAQTKNAATIFGDQKLNEEHYSGRFVEFLRN